MVQPLFSEKILKKKILPFPKIFLKNEKLQPSDFENEKIFEEEMENGERPFICALSVYFCFGV